MEPGSEIRECLTSRRAKLTPQQAGLPVFGDTRRVPGLRREEAAMLAGVSVDYYTKMERGNLRGVSQNVLDALALVQNGRGDVLAANRLGYALYSEMNLTPGQPANHARFVFLDPRAQHFFPDWERVADDTVGMLRTEAGRDPRDRNLSDLVGELSTQSDAFRIRWAAHNVRFHQTGTKRFHHPPSAN